MPHIVILNGSLRGKLGNSWKLALLAQEKLATQPSTTSSVLHLSEPKPAIADVYNILDKADGFLVITGTYWNNWSSPLQRFIEVATTFENSPAFFGKPIACGITMDSVGGIEVAARLHGVFSGLGCWSPPCSSLVISRVGNNAVASSEDQNEDVWRIDDLDIVLKNLVAATQVKAGWTSWPHSKLQISKKEWPDTGDLDMGTDVFL